MKDKYEIVLSMFYGFDLAAATAASPQQKTAAIVNGVEHILTLPPSVQEKPEDRKKRYLEACASLKRAFALSVPHEDAIEIRDEVGYMLAVAGRLSKVGGAGGGATEYDMEAAIA